jgi:hypothetical protein
MQTSYKASGSPNLWVCGKLTLSRVHLTGPPVQDLYRLTITKRCLNSCKWRSQRWMKLVVLFVFLCMVGRSTPYLLSVTLILSISVSVLTSGNRRNGRRSE